MLYSTLFLNPFDDVDKYNGYMILLHDFFLQKNKLMNLNLLSTKSDKGLIGMAHFKIWNKFYQNFPISTIHFIWSNGVFPWKCFYNEYYIIFLYKKHKKIKAVIRLKSHWKLDHWLYPRHTRYSVNGLPG